MGRLRAKASIPAPVSVVWDFLIQPENMHRWGPLTQPITGIDRPLQPGDRITQNRRDFFRHYSQVVLVEQVIPFRELHLRDLSKGGSRLNATGIISLEPDPEHEATWVEETVLYSLGQAKIRRWLDHWLINPLLQTIAAYKTGKALRRLQAIFARPRPTASVSKVS
jgi:hypothetical protein